MIVLALLQNLALLLAMVVGYRVLLSHWDRALWQHEVVSGVVLGAVAYLGMRFPVPLADGTILDGRTVVLFLAGAFGGPVVGLIGGTIVVVGRLFLGGAGAIVGAVSAMAAALGGVVVFRRALRPSELPSLSRLWLGAGVVHVLVATAYLTLLDASPENQVRTGILLILVVYTPVTFFASLIFRDYEKERLSHRALAVQISQNEALWDSMNDGAIAIDDTGRIQLMNTAAESLLGRNVDEIRGTAIADLLILEDARGRRPPWVRLVGSGGSTWPSVGDPHGGIFLVRADGSRTPVEVLAQPVSQDDRRGGGTLVLIRDRTAERKAWLALRESEQRIDLALDGGDLGIWDWHIPSGTVRFDTRWASMLGYTLDELEPRIETWSGLVHPDDVEPVMAEVEGHLADPRHHPYDVRLRLRHKNGSWVWILGRGRVVEFGPNDEPVRMAGTQADITDLVKAELRLAESEARFRRLVENAPDLVFRYRLLPEPGFDFVSPSATRILGYTPEEHYADPYLGRRIVHPDDAHLLDVATEGEPLQLRWIHKSGRLVWTEQRTVAVRDDEGRVVAIEGIARDVTERHAAEAKIRQLAESLEEKVRARTAELHRANQELEAFSYSVSHDLKAPLRAIDGYSALLQEDAGKLSAETRQMVAEVRRNAHRMGELIDGLLTFSRVGRTELAQDPVSLTELLTELVDDERVRAPERILEVTVGEIPKVRGDLILLRQAFANVLGNAVKFSAPRAVTRIEITGERVGDSVHVRIADNGVGFDDRYAHKLFRVFERLHHEDEFAGSGVGLATVKRIVERHGGHVAIASTLGEGTVVHIELPAPETGGGAMPDHTHRAARPMEEPCEMPIA